MLETQLVTYKIPADLMMPAGTSVSTLNFALNEEALIAKIGPGWKPVHHTVTPLPSREFLVSFMLTREPIGAPNEVPSDLLLRD